MYTRTWPKRLTATLPESILANWSSEIANSTQDSRIGESKKEARTSHRTVRNFLMVTRGVEVTTLYPWYVYMDARMQDRQIKLTVN